MQRCSQKRKSWCQRMSYEEVNCLNSSQCNLDCVFLYCNTRPLLHKHTNLHWTHQISIYPQCLSFIFNLRFKYFPWPFEGGECHAGWSVYDLRAKNYNNYSSRFWGSENVSESSFLVLSSGSTHCFVWTFCVMRIWYMSFCLAQSSYITYAL